MELSLYLLLGSTSNSYTWKQNPSHGVHYILVWAADWAGNISLFLPVVNR